VKPEGAAVTSLNRVLHLLGEDRYVAAVADLARTKADKRYPAGITERGQRASRQLFTDFVSRPRRRRQSFPLREGLTTGDRDRSIVAETRHT
jgi:hypothetical protein